LSGGEADSVAEHRPVEASVLGAREFKQSVGTKGGGQGSNVDEVTGLGPAKQRQCLIGLFNIKRGEGVDDTTFSLT